jgi:hypothetical protein
MQITLVNLTVLVSSASTLPEAYIRSTIRYRPHEVLGDLPADSSAHHVNEHFEWAWVWGWDGMDREVMLDSREARDIFFLRYRHS